MDATIISENVLRRSSIDAIIFLIVNHLYDASLVLENISSWSRIPLIIKRLNSFGWSTMRKFSEGSVLSIGHVQKVQLEVIYFYVVRKTEEPP